LKNFSPEINFAHVKIIPSRTASLEWRSRILGETHVTVKEHAVASAGMNGTSGHPGKNSRTAFEK
jgi:hypothetical protein